MSATTDWITAASSVAVALTSIGALVFAAVQVRESRRSVKIQHLMELTKQYEEKPITDLRRSVAKKILAGDADPEDLYDLINFFEQIGLLVNRGFLNAEDVWEMFGYAIFPLNATAKSSIDRKMKTDPNSYTNFAKLVRLVSAEEKKHAGTCLNPSEDEIREYWEDEFRSHSALARSGTRTLAANASSGTSGDSRKPGTDPSVP